MSHAPMCTLINSPTEEHTATDARTDQSSHACTHSKEQTNLCAVVRTRAHRRLRELAPPERTPKRAHAPSRALARSPMPTRAHQLVYLELVVVDAHDAPGQLSPSVRARPPL
eukprot:6209122-Pleurochrysis_carterae.AAC.1